MIQIEQTDLPYGSAVQEASGMLERQAFVRAYQYLSNMYSML